jgi:large subunit ribosomal protein L17
MRHRRRGRTLGRKPNHRRALLKNLASSLFLTERDDEEDELGREYPDFSTPNNPKVKGRIVTTVSKAKEVQPLVEKCISIAKRGLEAEAEADEYATGAERHSEQWKRWRNSDDWRQWNEAIAPAVTARRRCIQLLGNRFAVEILFDKIAERYADRDGGYTRILRLASARLGDAGPQAILELVGTHEREKIKSERPAFEDDVIEEEAVDEADEREEAAIDEEAPDESDADAAAADAEATADGDRSPAEDREQKNE